MHIKAQLVKIFTWFILLAIIISNVSPVYGSTPGQSEEPQDTPEPTATMSETPLGLSISGHVYDGSGDPLAGVMVSDDRGNSVMTAADGSYSITGLGTGKYVLIPALEAASFVPIYRVVNLLNTDISGVDFSQGEVIHPDRQVTGVMQFPSGNPIIGSEKGNDLWQPVEVQEPTNEDMSAQAVYKLGVPGKVYRFQESIGSTEVPYLTDAAHLNSPSGLSVDTSQNLFVTESHGRRLLGYDSSGSQFLNVGKPGMGSYANEVFMNPQDVTYDSAGNLWMLESNRLLKMDNAGIFISQTPETFPGIPGTDNDRFLNPVSLVVGDGYLYISDSGNQRIQVYIFSVDTLLYFRTIGETGVAGSDNNHFNQPGKITFFDHTLYVADTQNDRIMRCQMIVSSANCTALVLTGSAISAAALVSPSAVAFSPSELYIADAGNYRVLQCNQDGSNCVHFAGIAGEAGFAADHFTWISDLAAGSDGKVYISDSENHRVQVYDNTGLILNTIGTLGANGEPEPYLLDSTHFNAPSGVLVAVESSVNYLYITEEAGQRLLKYDPTSHTVIWSRGQAGVSGSDDAHFGNWEGGPLGNLARDKQNRIYVPDTYNHRVQIYLPNGDLWGTMGISGEPGTDSSHFNFPTAVAINQSGDIYVADSGNHRIQIFDLNRMSKGTIGKSGEAGVDSKHFNTPLSIALDSSGNVYVVDTGNHRVQKCTTMGVCNPFEGKTGLSASGFDYLTNPKAIAIGNNQIFVADSGRNRIQVFDTNGAYLTTLAGDWGTRSGDLRDSVSITTDSSSNVYVADPVNHRIQIYAANVPGWSQLNLNGFGYQYNSQIHAVESFGGSLYVSSYNLKTNVAEIRRMDFNGNWSVVTQDGFGDSDNRVVNDLIEFSGKLYASTMNLVSGGQVWSSTDGITWTLEALPTDFDTWNAEIAQMAVFNGKLYIGTVVYGMGTPDHGAQIWSYDPVALTWSNVYEAADLSTTAVTAFTVMGDYLYAGLEDETLGGQVYRCSITVCSNTTDWEHVFVDGNGSVNAISVDSLAVFNEGADKLYAGITNPTDGAMVYEGVCDGLGCIWLQVNTNGFGSIDNTMLNALYVFDGKLMAFTRNAETGFQMWAYSAGTWSEYLSDRGFGNSTNRRLQSQASVCVFNSRLIVGTVNLSNAGGVWASLPAAYVISGTINGISSQHKVEVQLFKNKVLVQNLTGIGSAYSFAAVLDGKYVVQPYSRNYAFTPRLVDVEVAGGDFAVPAFLATYHSLPLESPKDGSRLEGNSVTLTWTNLGALKYEVNVSYLEDFSTIYKKSTSSTNTLKLNALPYNKMFFWRVRDTSIKPIVWSTTWAFYTPDPPGVPTLLLPTAGAVLTGLSPDLTWKAGTGTPVAYRVQVSTDTTFSYMDLDELTVGPANHFQVYLPLGAAKTYFWRVRALNSSGDVSPWTVARKFYTLAEAPTLLYPASGQIANSLRPTFTWNDPQGTGSYQIQITIFGTQIVSANPTSPFYTPLVSLVPYNQYWWRVRSKGAGGFGPWSFSQMFYAPNPPLATTLDLPLNNAILPGYQTAFNWALVTGASQYRLQVSTTSTFPPNNLFLDKWVIGSSYDMMGSPDVTFAANTAYFWRVAACNSMQQCSLYTSARKLLTKPGIPQLLLPADAAFVNQLGITFTWEDQPTPAKPLNSSGFKVEILTNADCTGLVKTLSASKREATTTLAAGITYYWHVKANGIGGTAGAGDWSACRSIIVEAPPGLPKLIKPELNFVVPDYRNIAFEWTAPGDGTATGYELQISKYSTFSSLELSKDGITTNSWTEDTTTYLWGGGVYYWRVRAKNLHDLWGKWSTPLKFSTLSTVYGYVMDVTVPEGPVGIAEVNISLKVGETILTTTTGTGSEGDLGYYIIHNVPTGSADVTASKTGYITRTENVVVKKTSQNLLDFGFAPLPAANMYTIYLSWPSLPYRNLDIHFWTPNGAYRSHIFTSNYGSLTSAPFTHLDAYNNQYNTEIITLDRQNMFTGKYVLGVNQSYPGTGTLTGSKVKVSIYDETGAEVAGPYTAPTSVGSGLWWNLLEFEKLDGVMLDISSATGTVPTVIDKVQTTSPAPYTGDEGIYGVVRVQGSTRGFAGIQITITGASNAVVKTDMSGYFSVGGLPAGPYILEPSVPGYTVQTPSERTVTLTTGDQYVWNWAGYWYLVPDGDTGGEHRAIAILGDFVYMASGPSLDIINIKDKNNPILVKRFIPSAGKINDIVIQGNYAYLACEDGLNIVDISNPAVPILAGYYVVYGGPTAVAVKGRYVYLSYGWGDLFIIDANIIYNPVYVSEFHLPGYMEKLVVQGDYVYAAYGNTGEIRGLSVINISNPNRPSKVATMDVTGYPIDLAVSGNYVYLVGGVDYDYITLTYTGGRMNVFDISNPASPKQVVEISRTNPVYNVAIGDGHVYLANSAGGLALYETGGSDTMVSEFSTDGDAWAVSYYGNYLYLGTADKMQVVDVHNQTVPTGRGIYIPAP